MICNIENIYLLATIINVIICVFLCLSIILQTPKDTTSFGQTNLWGNSKDNLETSNHINIFFEKITWFFLCILIIFILFISVLLRMS